MAEILGISVKTLYNWRTLRPPQGPTAIEIRGRLRWKKIDVQAWIDKHHNRDAP